MQNFCNLENGSFPESTVNEGDHDDLSNTNSCFYE